jgi:hypothetical protein
LLSWLRPTDEPSFPFDEAEMTRRWERAQRKQGRADIRLAREVRIAEGKAPSEKLRSDDGCEANGSSAERKSVSLR